MRLALVYMPANSGTPNASVDCTIYGANDKVGFSLFSNLNRSWKVYKKLEDIPYNFPIAMIKVLMHNIYLPKFFLSYLILGKHFFQQLSKSLFVVNKSWGKINLRNNLPVIKRLFNLHKIKIQLFYIMFVNFK